MTRPPCHHITAPEVLGATLERKGRPLCPQCDSAEIRGRADGERLELAAANKAELAARVKAGRITRAQAESLERYARPESLIGALDELDRANNPAPPAGYGKPALFDPRTYRPPAGEQPQRPRLDWGPDPLAEQLAKAAGAKSAPTAVPALNSPALTADLARKLGATTD